MEGRKPSSFSSSLWLSNLSCNCLVTDPFNYKYQSKTRHWGVLQRMQFPSKMFILFLTEFRIHVDTTREDVQSTLALQFADRWEECVGKTWGKQSRISDLGTHSLSSTDEWKENKWKLQDLAVFKGLFNSLFTKQFVFTKGIFKYLQSKN